MSKARRELWKRRIKNFWFEYAHNKIGLLGLSIVLFYVGMAVIGPWVAPYAPHLVTGEAEKQADKFAVPTWIRLFRPDTADLPPTLVYPLNWSVEELPSGIKHESTGTKHIFYYNASKCEQEVVDVLLTWKFNYTYSPLRSFRFSPLNWRANPDKVKNITRFIAGKWRILGTKGSMEYMLQIVMKNPNESYAIWDQNWYQVMNTQPTAGPEFWLSEDSQSVTLSAGMGRLARKLGYQEYETDKMARDLFSTKGTYEVDLRVTFRAPEEYPPENSTGTLTVTGGELIVWGRQFGLLGTDGYGHDVLSQIIHGSAISLAIGLTAAVISVLFGILVGVTAGYTGGVVDESLMRIVDVLLCLPVLPLILALSVMFGYNIWYIVLIIAIFGWQGLSRTIRSQVLSLREMPFIECAVASGGTKSYIMFRHLIPNILPIALSSLVLSVPGAIILEAALSFLGFGDPLSPSWGRMLHYARQTGGFSPTHLAWWVILPPGLAITFICLAFVFIGQAIDEIVNPRLRRRR